MPRAVPVCAITRLRRLSAAVTLKLLLANEQCGALIGKGGSTVIGLQGRFGITLKLGGPDDLFPGTFFRPAVIRGTVAALRGALEAIVSILWTVRHPSSWLRCAAVIASSMTHGDCMMLMLT